MKWALKRYLLVKKGVRDSGILVVLASGCQGKQATKKKNPTISDGVFVGVAIPPGREN